MKQPTELHAAYNTSELLAEIVESQESVTMLIPKGVTHGEVFMKMFKTVFPKTLVIYGYDENNLTISPCFTQEWWNEPYDAECYARIRKESEAAEQ